MAWDVVMGRTQGTQDTKQGKELELCVRNEGSFGTKKLQNLKLKRKLDQGIRKKNRGGTPELRSRNQDKKIDRAAETKEIIHPSRIRGNRGGGYTKKSEYPLESVVDKRNMRDSRKSSKDHQFLDLFTKPL